MLDDEDYKPIPKEHNVTHKGLGDFSFLLLIAVTMLGFFLFSGTPDVHDAIIYNLMGGSKGIEDWWQNVHGAQE